MKHSEQTSAHAMISELECSNSEFFSKVSAKDMMLDLKYLIREYYLGTFTNDGESLKLQFNNGQTFLLTLKEMTQE